MPIDWILLIYTLPAQPSRKRASIWRELKKVGAVYLRDGVAALPRFAGLEERVAEMVRRIEEYGGTAELLVSPQFRGNGEARLVKRFRAERAEEYGELHHACVRFLRDVLEDVDAEDFGFPDVDKLESELGRLKRWAEQIEARDYFGAPGADRVQDILAKCERAFESFANSAHARLTGSSEAAPEDVFERLGGAATAEDAVPSDYPL